MDLNIGIIGCGHWGSNYIRLFQAWQGCQVALCADVDSERLAAVRQQHPGVRTTQDIPAALLDPSLQALVIATPAFTHFDLVRQALLAGKDVLCEKPLALRAEQGRELVGLARQQQKVLMVGHTFLFNTGIRYLKTCLTEGLLGQLYYISSARTNLGPVREDVNALFDLASHDIAIFNYLLDAGPSQVSACGRTYLQHAVEDVAFLTLAYPGQVMAHAHVSWMDPVKVRTLTLVGSQKMITWDDLNIAEPIRIYDVGIIQEPYYADFGQFHLLPRQGDTTIPRLKQAEPLKVQIEAFIQALQERTVPLSDGAFATEVVRILEAAQVSLRAQGAPVNL